jgi:hypothetical protein
MLLNARTPSARLHSRSIIGRLFFEISEENPIACTQLAWPELAEGPKGRRCLLAFGQALALRATRKIAPVPLDARLARRWPNIWGGIVAIYGSSPLFFGKTRRVLLALRFFAPSRRSGFRGSRSAKLEGFALLNRISASCANRKAGPGMRLQAARKKRHVQNPLALEGFEVLHFYVAKTRAKPGRIRTPACYPRRDGRLLSVTVTSATLPVSSSAT